MCVPSLVKCFIEHALEITGLPSEVCISFTWLSCISSLLNTGICVNPIATPSAFVKMNPGSAFKLSRKSWEGDGEGDGKNPRRASPP